MFGTKPVVAVTPLYDDEKKSYWMLPGYMQAIEQQGAIPMMPPLTAQTDELDYFLAICDGFLLTGGHDVAPVCYDAARQPYCGAASSLRDQMESYLLRRAAEQDKPVLGICRGMQLMNTVYGGTLYQDLPREHPTAIAHHMTPPYDRAAHVVTVLPDTPLAQVLGAGACAVNSYHHQAVRLLSPRFAAMATAPDGLIEAIYMPEKQFVWGVQWHPEFFFQTDESSRRIMAAFVRAAGAAR